MLILNEFLYEFIESILHENYGSVNNPMKWIRSGFNNDETYNAYIKNFALNLDYSNSVNKSMELLILERKNAMRISGLQVEKFNSLLNKKLPGMGELDIVINFFVGCGTCSAFPYIANSEFSINIALEKLVQKKNIYNSILDLITHEIIHILRMKNGKYRANTFGELIIEEGISCYSHESILEIGKSEFHRIFPLDPARIGVSEMESYFKKIENKLDSSDLKEVYYGNKELPSGISYFYGYHVVKKIVMQMELNLNQLIKDIECEYILKNIRSRNN